MSLTQDTTTPTTNPIENTILVNGETWDIDRAIEHGPFSSDTFDVTLKKVAGHAVATVTCVKHVVLGRLSSEETAGTTSIHVTNESVDIEGGKNAPFSQELANELGTYLMKPFVLHAAGSSATVAPRELVPTTAEALDDMYAKLVLTEVTPPPKKSDFLKYPSFNNVSKRSVGGNDTWFVTEKYDGSNAVVRMNKETGAIDVASRNQLLGPLAAQEKKALFGAVPLLQSIEGKLKGLCTLMLTQETLPVQHDVKFVQIFGEVYGPGVQKTQYRTDKGFVIFDVFLVNSDNTKATVCNLFDVQLICEFFGLDCVETLHKGTFDECIEFSLNNLEAQTTVPDTLGFTRGLKPFVREGHVLRNDCIRPEITIVNGVELYGYGTRLKHKGDMVLVRKPADALKRINTDRLRSLIDKENGDFSVRNELEWKRLLIKDAIDECRQVLDSGAFGIFTEEDYTKVEAKAYKDASIIVSNVAREFYGTAATNGDSASTSAAPASPSSAMNSCSSTILIENLDPLVTEGDLSVLLTNYGKLEEVVIKRDQAWLSTGSATVKFTSPLEAAKAVGELNGAYINDQEVAVTLAGATAKPSISKKVALALSPV